MFHFILIKIFRQKVLTSKIIKVTISSRYYVVLVIIVCFKTNSPVIQFHLFQDLSGSFRTKDLPFRRSP